MSTKARKFKDIILKYKLDSETLEIMSLAMEHVDKDLSYWLEGLSLTTEAKENKIFYKKTNKGK